MCVYPKTIGLIEETKLFSKKNIYCVGSRQTDKYLYANKFQADAIYLVLNHMDGNSSLQKIEDDINLNSNTKINVNKIYQISLNAGLIKTTENYKVKRQKDELELLTVNLKNFQLLKLYPLFKKLSRSIPIIMCLIIIADLSAVTLAVLKPVFFPWDEIMSDIRALIYLFIISLFSLIIHEFSHAIVGYRYGIKPRSFSVAIFAFSSMMFYIKLPGIYFLPENKRIKTWGAGIFSNLFLTSIFYIIYSLSSGQVKIFASVGVINNVMTILVNIMPFYYSDGYYILSTVLETPNLRKKSLLQIKKLIKMKLNKDVLVYWIYLFVTLLVTASLIITQTIVAITVISSKYKHGQNLFQILKNYSNLLLLILVSVTVKIISTKKKKKI